MRNGPSQDRSLTQYWSNNPITSPFTWTLELLLSFNIYFQKSFKVTQSPRVPRVRGGDPSGVAPGKVEGFFSASGHPWKLFSWKLSPPVHPCWNQWCLDVHFSLEGSKNHPSSWSIIIFLLLIHIIIPFRDFLIFFFQRFSYFLPV